MPHRGILYSSSTPKLMLLYNTSNVLHIEKGGSYPRGPPHLFQQQ